MKGLFIAIEGADFSGKTSTVMALKDKHKGDSNYVFLKEPGGCDTAEDIRDVIMAREMDKFTEMLLFEAARRENYLKIIKPALEAGKIVIADRFDVSTLVYQGTHVCGIRTSDLSMAAVDGNGPEAYIYLSVRHDTQKKRAAIRTEGNDRMDNQSEQEMCRIIKSYDSYLKPHKGLLHSAIKNDNFIVETDEATIEETAEKVDKIITRLYNKKKGEA